MYAAIERAGDGDIEQLGLQAWFRLTRESLLERRSAAAQDAVVDALSELFSEKGHESGAAVVDVCELKAVGAASVLPTLRRVDVVFRPVEQVHRDVISVGHNVVTPRSAA